MNQKQWDEVSILFVRYADEIKQLIGRDIYVVNIVQDSNDNVAGVLHSCSPQLAESMIHDAFDKYDASEVQEVLDNEQETKPRT